MFGDGPNQNVPPRKLNARNEKKLKELMQREKYIEWKNRSTTEYHDDLLDEAIFTYMLRPQEYNDTMNSYMDDDKEDEDVFKRFR